MPDIIHRGGSVAGTLSLVVAVLVGWLVLVCSLTSENDARASSSPAETTPKRQGDAEQGRKVFNGKGVCDYCHGKDGHLDQRPQLAPDTTAFIDRLNPKPADLRNPSSLKLKTDNERFRLIREGHLGTGMFPDMTLTDKEIKDILAYLSTLRQEVSSKGKP
jgi:mono/diheme cytochrome c family protein